MTEDSLPPDWWTESYNPFAALGMYRFFDDEPILDSDEPENERDAGPSAEEEDPRFR